MKQIILYISLTLLLSCTNTQELETCNNTITINKPISTNFIDIIDSIKVIPLGNDSVIVAEVTKILTTKKYYIILDKRQEKIFTYTKDWNLKYILQSRGNGPNEYNSIASIDVIESSNQLLIYDYNSHKLLFFNIDNGEFIKNDDIAELPFVVAHLNNNQYLYIHDINIDPEEKFCITIKDKAGKSNKYIKNKIVKPFQLTSQNSFAKMPNGDILYAPSLSNRIYKIDTLGNVSTEYCLLNKSEKYKTLSAKQLLDAEISPMKNNTVTGFVESSYLCQSNHIGCSNEIIVASYYHFPQNIKIFYNIQSKRSITYDSSGSLLPNETDWISTIFYPSPSCIDGEYILIAPTTYLLDRTKEQIEVYSNEGTHSEKYLQLRDIISKTDENLPVIIAYKIKWQ